MRKLALSAVAALFICASLTTAPSLFAQQYPRGDFSLYGGQMEISDAGWPFNAQEQQLFSAAAIQVNGSKVTMGASFGSTYDFGYGPANGTTSISGEGQYDSQAGAISGTFTYTNNISGAADDLSGTLTTDCQGTFSTPPISAAQATVTASFTGTVNITTTVGGESVTDSRDWSRDVVYKVAAVEQKVAEDSGVRFSDLSGDVEILLPGTGEDNWKMARLNMVLPYGTLIRTQDDSSALLSFPDMTSLVMESETTIDLGDKPEEPSNLKILMGNILVNVKHMIEYGGMKVEMSQAVAGIKGTVFSLEEDGTTSTLKVFEGTVEFESRATGESVEVAAGRTVSADRNGLGEIADFDTQAEMAEWEALGAEPVLEPGSEADRSAASEPDGFPVWLLIVLIALAALILATIIILLVRRSKAGKGTADGTSQTGMPPLQDGPAPRNEPESQPAAPGSFCTGCGTPLREGRAFCRNCGKKA